MQRNEIGTHSGAYAIYRALAVASGTLDRDHRPDFTNTALAEAIGPYPQWADPDKIVSLDPYGHMTSQVYAEQASAGMFPELVTRHDLKVFLPPIGGMTLYCFGDMSRLGQESTRIACRVHDECNGSDVFGSDICTCRPYLAHGIEVCIEMAQQAGRRSSRAHNQRRHGILTTREPGDKGVFMSDRMTLITHPLIQHKLTIMRNEETTTDSFRRLLREISQMLAYEVTRNLPTELVEIRTPVASVAAPAISGKKFEFFR